MAGELAPATLVVVRDSFRAEPTEVPEVLRPRAALGEILALCDSVISGAEPPQARDRRSLAADAQAALSALGKNLKRELQPTLSDFLTGELKALPNLLSERGGTVRLRHATQVLEKRLESPPAAVAAWRDLLEAADTGIELRKCRLHALQLRELEERRGHEWTWRRQRLLEVVQEETLEECEELIKQPPSRTAQVVWLMYSRADIWSGDYQRLGQVQFFSERLVPDTIRKEQFFEQLPDGEFPVEIDDYGLEQLEVDKEVEGPLVYVRVELTGPRAADPNNPWSHSVPPSTWARRLVDGIVKAATFRIGGSAWQLLDGEAIYHGTLSDSTGTYGNWSGATPFVDPLVAKRQREWIAPPNERTGTALSELDIRFVDHLAANMREARAAVQEVDWFESAEEQADIGQRLMLRVRAFERALPTTGSWHWNEAAKHYRRESWALEKLSNRLFYLAYNAHRTLRDQRADLSGIEEWFTPDGDGFVITLGAFLRMIPRILPLIEAKGDAILIQRQLREVGKWEEDPAAVHSYLQRFAQNFDTLLARALRQRNGIVHGLDGLEEVVLSVDDFVSRLAATLVAQAVHGAATGDDLVEALARDRDTSRRTFLRLKNGDHPVSRVLFRAEAE